MNKTNEELIQEIAELKNRFLAVNNAYINLSLSQECCRNCKHYIENNPIKNVYPKDLCTNILNKQSALSGNQFMQVSPKFYCNNFEFFNDNGV